jgi:hypothetical protein
VVPVPPQTAPRSDKPTTGERVMRKNLAVLFAVAVMFAAVPMFGAVYLCPTEAGCSVPFPSTNGSEYSHGFSGKGDVQLAFGWNDAAFQKMANDVYFTYEDLAEYEVTCKKLKGNGEWKTNVFKNRKFGVSATLDLEVRKNSKGKVNGYGFVGLQENGGGGNDGWCPAFDGDDEEGPWFYVSSKLTGEVKDGGLFVNRDTKDDKTISVPLEFATWPIE